MIDVKLLMNERMRDFYEVGPVQHAAVEDFTERLIDECCVIIYNALMHRLPASTYPSLIREEFNL